MSFSLSDFLKFLGMVITIIVTSLMLFPISLISLPQINSKHILAVVGILFILITFIKNKTLSVEKDYLLLIILSVLVSFCGFISVTFNNTSDYAYTTYVVSAVVWFGAAYTVCGFIHLVHKRNSCLLLINYLIAVCVFQCIAALLIDLQPAVKSFVDAHIQQGQEFLNSHRVRRLYGIGASLDVAGTRFSAVLIMIGYVLSNRNIKKSTSDYLVYTIAFFVIGLIGNMIARTTTIGIIIGIIYFSLVSLREFGGISREYMRLWKWFFFIFLIGVPVAVYFYQTNPKIRKNIRFGFEGFFNYFERGNFSYDSNEKLKSMYVWPDNAKTWLVGDGYFSSPLRTDPYYTGRDLSNFYKGTDVGYQRFLFYFGIIGLLAFSFFILICAIVCEKRFSEWKYMFLLLALLNFAVWFKVATDIFLVFALFLGLDYKQHNEDYLHKSGDI